MIAYAYIIVKLWLKYNNFLIITSPYFPGNYKFVEATESQLARIVNTLYFCFMAEVKPTKQDKIIKRNDRIRKRFAYYTDTKHFDSQYALDLLEDEYLPLERETIWLIVRRTGHYKNL